VAEVTVGNGEVWPDPRERKPDWRDIPIPIPANVRITEADRLGYEVRVHYMSTHGDPKWNGRLKADAVLEGGGLVPVMGETRDFDMGHGKVFDGPFPFNK
jgi:hypothetical protein